MTSPSFSVRYHVEETEQIQLDSFLDKQEVKADDKKLQDDISDIEKKGKESPFLSKLNRRTGSLEEGETWRFLTDIKGRITKTVGEKIEEISKKKKGPTGLGSSISDSEERSESSSLREEDSERKGVGGTIPNKADDSDQGDWSDGTPKPSSESTTPELWHHRPHRKRRRKTAERIEVGVEAIESEMTSSVISSGSVGVDSHLLEPVPGPGLLPALQTWAPLILPAILAIIHHTIDISPFLKGLLFGVMVAVEVMYLRERVSYALGHVDYDLEMVGERASTPLFETFPVFPESTFYVPDPHPEHKLYEGWMNEFKDEYDPTIYHISLTSSVFIHLEGSWLRLGSTKQKIPKRAFWSEPFLKPNISHERAYNLEGCQVLLLPQGLANKRLWSKKYPICIKLVTGALIGMRGKTPMEEISIKDKTKEGFDITDVQKNEIKADENEFMDTFEVMDESTSLVLVDDDETEFDDAEEDDELDSEFVEVPDSLVNRSNLYLFARSDREKEIWYRRFVAATGFESKNVGIKNDERMEKEKKYLDFMKQTSYIKSHAQKIKLKGKGVTCGDVWINALLGRIIYDVLLDPFWLSKIQEKIQRKLSAIKIPVFMDELVISSLDCGNTMPVVTQSSEPLVNEQGLWVDLEVSYQGSFSMTVDTKINIMKLKNPQQLDSESPQNNAASTRAIFDSGAEDSAESSSEEPTVTRVIPGGQPKKKVLRVVDKIAASKYFQQVTDNKFVKRALEGVSNTNISLIVQVKGLVGTLVLNIPPPPSNRLWYGFRAKPKLWLSAQPKWGERTINMLNMTSWIEKKLYQEFQKILVLPNMDDFVVPLMNKDLPS